MRLLNSPIICCKCDFKEAREGETQTFPPLRIRLQAVIEVRSAFAPQGSPQAADPLLGQPSRTEQGQPAASPPGEDLKEESALNGSRQSKGRGVQKHRGVDQARYERRQEL